MSSISTLVGKFFNKEKFANADIKSLEQVLKNFCETGKKEDAFSVYFCFSEIFNVFGSKKDSSGKLLNLLADYEYHSGELLSSHRDHYSHSVYVFALGIALFANNDALKDKIYNFYNKFNFTAIDFLKYWGLVALFHDVGYPFELAHAQVKSYCEALFGDNLEALPRVGYENMDYLLSLKEEVEYDDKRFNKTNDLLSQGITKRLGYDFNVVKKILDERYHDKVKFMDHGYFSALLLLNQLIESKQECWEIIVDCLTAIALHNSLNRYDFGNVFNNTVMEIEKHPFAYLLMLCDELQNWDRIAFGYISKKDPLAWGVNIKITQDSLNVVYLFENEDVLTSEQTETFEIKQSNKRNKNVNDIISGQFIQKLQGVIVPFITINATYKIACQMEKSKKFASSDKFINIYSIAQAIHRSYQLQYGGVDFEYLSLDFKLSNIEQAKSYAEKLELINCFYSDKEMDYPIVRGFEYSKAEKDRQIRRDLGFLAREEHIRWVKEKLALKWKYGKEGIDYTKENRNKKRRNKDLIPFDYLEESEQQKNELMIQNMVKFLYHFGKGIRIYSFREGRKPVLNIAGCGHSTIKPSKKLKNQIKDVLRSYQEEYRVVVRTTFALGAELLIAECANELGITLKATLPLPYEEYIESLKRDAEKNNYIFTDKDEFNIRHLLAQTASCKPRKDEKTEYLDAVKDVITKSDKLIVLWDGIETKLQDEKGNPINQGCTWYRICLARNARKMQESDIHIIKCER